jgi:hypothetical protein
MEAFRKYRYNAAKASKSMKTKRSVIVHHMMNKVRSYFEEWKKEAAKREIIRYNHEEGPVRMEHY